MSGTCVYKDDNGAWYLEDFDESGKMLGIHYDASRMSISIYRQHLKALLKIEEEARKAGYEYLYSASEYDEKTERLWRLSGGFIGRQGDKMTLLIDLKEV